MKDTLSKLYESLLPIERTNLFLAALARGDIEEAKKIKSSCPRRTYIIQDLTYLNLSLGLERIVNYFLFNHQRATQNIALFNLAISVASELFFECEKDLNEAQIGNEQATMEEALAKKEQRLSTVIDCQNKLDEIKNKQVIYLKSLHVGFKMFCLESSINYKNAMTLMANTVTDGFSEFQSNEYIAAAENTELSENIKKEFLRLWN